jgi:hypothetical protein
MYAWSEDRANISTGSKQLEAVAKMCADGKLMPTPALSTFRCSILGVPYSGHVQLQVWIVQWSVTVYWGLLLLRRC